MRSFTLITILLISFTSFTGAEASQPFPLWGKKLREQGIELPLPYGITAMVSRVEEDNTDITKVKIDGLGTIRGVEFLESKSETEAFNVRADLWLLPFLNVYLIGGYLDGESTTTVDISGLLIGNGYIFDIREGYHGTSLGAGATLIYGSTKHNWIASVDINYIKTELNVVDSDIKSLTISPRLCYRMRQLGVPLIIGFGGSYLQNDQRLTAKIPLENMGETLTAKVNIENKQNWNAAVLAGVELNRHWQLLAEMGFHDREVMVAMLTYRF